MRSLNSRLRSGIVIDVVLLVVLTCLLVAFIQHTGTSLPRVQISFQSVDSDPAQYGNERRNDDSSWNSRRDSRPDRVNVRHSMKREDTDADYGDIRKAEDRRLRGLSKTGNVLPLLTINSKLRKLPDARPLQCQELQYDMSYLKKSTTLVIQFTDYELYDAEVTLSSVFNNVDEVDHDVLAEIVLLDASSKLVNVRDEAEKYVELLKTHQANSYSPPVRLVRIDSENGGKEDNGKQFRGSKRRVRWPKMVGADAIKTDVVVFVSPGVVVGTAWLTPLVSPLLIKEKGSGSPSAVESHLDSLRSPVNLEYQRTFEDLIPVPAWSLAVQMRRLPKDRNPKKSDDKPLRSIPVLRGTAFAVNMRELESLGGLLDEELDVNGGGEYLELSLRLWMCGGGIQQASCSRVAVPGLSDDIRVVSPANVHRIADTWFADRKSMVYQFGGHRKEGHGSSQKDFQGSSRRALDRDKCRDFEWYLKTASMGSLISPSHENVSNFGMLQVQTGRCARVSKDKRINLDYCEFGYIPQRDSMFELTTDGRLRSTLSGECLTVTSAAYVGAEKCLQPVEAQQKWSYNSNGELVNDLFKACATHVTDPDKSYAGRQIMMSQHCHRPGDKDYEQFKTWQFTIQ